MLAAFRLDPGCFFAQGRIGDLHQPAVAAAVGQFAVIVVLDNIQSESGTDITDTGSHDLMVPGRAGIVDSQRLFRPAGGGSFCRQLQAVQHLPEGNRLYLCGKFLE